MLPAVAGPIGERLDLKASHVDYIASAELGGLAAKSLTLSIMNTAVKRAIAIALPMIMHLGNSASQLVSDPLSIGMTRAVAW